LTFLMKTTDTINKYKMNINTNTSTICTNLIYNRTFSSPICNLIYNYQIYRSKSKSLLLQLTNFLKLIPILLLLLKLYKILHKYKIIFLRTVKMQDISLLEYILRLLRVLMVFNLSNIRCSIQLISNPHIEIYLKRFTREEQKRENQGIFKNFKHKYKPRILLEFRWANNQLNGLLAEKFQDKIRNLEETYKINFHLITMLLPNLLRILEEVTVRFKNLIGCNPWQKNLFNVEIYLKLKKKKWKLIWSLVSSKKEKLLWQAQLDKKDSWN